MTPLDPTLRFTCRACSSVVTIQRLPSGAIVEKGHQKDCLPREIAILKHAAQKDRSKDKILF